MFRTELPISHTKACTKELEPVEFILKIRSGQAANERVALRVIDAPGLGESIETDPKYLEMYDQHLSACDAVLWVMAARNRAVALDQMYLERYKQLANKIVFGINQVDLAHPMDWNENINLPSSAMKENIVEIVDDRIEKIKQVVHSDPIVVAYSANRGYQLERLFKALMSVIPPDRKWIYAGLKAFTFRDFFQLSNPGGSA